MGSRKTWALCTGIAFFLTSCYADVLSPPVDPTPPPQDGARYPGTATYHIVIQGGPDAGDYSGQSNCHVLWLYDQVFVDLAPAASTPFGSAPVTVAVHQLRPAGAQNSWTGPPTIGLKLEDRVYMSSAPLDSPRGGPVMGGHEGFALVERMDGATSVATDIAASYVDGANNAGEVRLRLSLICRDGEA